MCLLRDQSAEYGMATLVQSLPYRDWIVGVGLDSDEKGNPPVKFAEVFKRARAEGYQVTMHCDVDQEDSVEHIRQCLVLIGVDRIDHGVNILESAELTAELKRRGLGLTVCPISNRWVTGDLKAAQIKQMLELGLRVTVNSDDPAYFAGYVTDNLIAAQQAAGLRPGRSAAAAAQRDRDRLAARRRGRRAAGRDRPVRGERDRAGLTVTSWVLHVDLDQFIAAVEVLRHPELRGARWWSAATATRPSAGSSPRPPTRPASTACIPGCRCGPRPGAARTRCSCPSTATSTRRPRRG